MGDAQVIELEIAAGNSDSANAVYSALRGVRGIQLDAATVVQEDEQGGALDLLAVALSGGAITTFLQIIKSLLDRRGPGFVLKVRRGREWLEITAKNPDEAMKALRELLGGPS